jgi:CPA1 family monovalent cation:H+ antiporter
MIEAALGKLEGSVDRVNPQGKALYDDVKGHYRLRLAALERDQGGVQSLSHEQERFEKLTRELRNAERAAAVQLRDQDRISDEVLRALLRELDLLDARPSTVEESDGSS